MEKIKVSPYLFRGYDIRGADPEYVASQHIKEDSLRGKSAYGSPLSEEVAYVIGRAIATTFGPKKVVVGQDTRLSSPRLTASLIRGLTDQGVDVDEIGLASTELFYYAIGKHKYDMGVSTTGSHTEKFLNGFKISRFIDGHVFPIAKGTGIEELRDAAIEQNFPVSEKKGTIRKKEVLTDFTADTLSHFNFQSFKKQKIVFDSGNGVGGISNERIIDALPIEAVKINFKPDGNFPNHEPNPMIRENVQQLIEKMDQEKADFGIAWDGDADRATFVSPKGEILTGSFIAPMLLSWVAEKHPGANVVETISMSWAISEKAKELGLMVTFSKVGNSFVKIVMREVNAPFACEESGHFMFEESFFAESSILPTLIVLDQITKTGKSFSQMLAEVHEKVIISGDVNIEVHDAAKVMAEVEKVYVDEGGELNKLDGITISFDDWHFTLRPSTNDPVIRLNLEAKSTGKLEEEVLRIKEIVKKSEK